MSDDNKPEDSSEGEDQRATEFEHDQAASEQDGQYKKDMHEGRRFDAEKVADISKKAAEKTSEILGNSYQKVREYDPKTSIHKIDHILNWVRETFPPDMFDKMANWCAKYGHAGIVAAQILVLVFFALKAVKTGSFSRVFYGVGAALLLIILQYTAEKFLYAGKQLIQSTPSSLSSTAFLDCTALIMEISGVLIFISMATQGIMNALVGLAIWGLFDSIAWTAIHPKMVNVSIEDEVRAGEEAIGILSFFAKAVLMIVPIAYGIGAIVGTLALALAIIAVAIGKTAMSGQSAIWLIIVCACLPFLSYVAFMVYHLLIDLLQSILVLPRKLDETKK